VEQKLNKSHFFCGATKRTSGTKLRKEKLLNLYEATVVQLMLRGCETGTLRKDQARRQTLGLRLLRSFVAYTLSDRGSEDVRRQL
jgi:hypothetical protein